ncbi:MAG TPA: bifunctional diaminohydroxyphosphoribosylaminopyrimidine deaminase/5-amino-6-(5-phosphoribosylamino)uracil reductase RibD [Accumulibacter sp.]|nr:bifunctional diaminohydroxyphosphoribosylaminopyrimidine deaminase/5-amino-6-(5-phosphoribosylamino)uracil reductase RibD [Accumulibacter sp.]HMW16568.1 bifunctional diaminohydroxyphosphoribosylaminopyrimidine deaminase/5-amino-6-(5-phosphoribosylamino)uracil reductase RibD [Accumulibacter sp.]HMX23587.1 bifunctional diaminohydroxyphosphoribosylaminopyrimidine deaminase/5-amino-6-(5-phosphoribosylamino)uracil reductase RibD [Accumulibacter sp.]HNC18186.1 bifunctional diaminohydroxyphosphoribo
MTAAFSAVDHVHMARALRLAELGLYSTAPNPRVGCVLVNRDQVVGEGWHRRAGEAHAEILALRAAGERSHGATAYVTLEPCSHQGRTPPCSEALLAAGVSRVVAAMEDPNPLVAGRGLAALRQSGVDVQCGLLEDAARELNPGFISRMTRGRPWLRLKMAASLDGKTALNNGQSQWLTGPAARQDGHRWRARACAILSGIGTVLHDDPQLNVRGVAGLADDYQLPLKVIVDAGLQLPQTARLLADGRVLVATAIDDPAALAGWCRPGVEVVSLPDGAGRVDLPALLGVLAARGINEVHAEAGAGLAGALLVQNLVDELLLYLAPTLIGNDARGLFEMPALVSLSDKRALNWFDVRMVGADLRVRARVN